MSIDPAQLSPGQYTPLTIDPTTGTPTTITANTTIGDANAILQQTLDTYGLTSLSGWVWQQIQSGAGSDQIMLALRQQPAFQQRFPGNTVRQQNGFAELDPATYLSTEASYRAILAENGLPAPNDPGAYSALIGNDRSPDELKSDLEAYHTVATTFTPYMRNLFDQYAGMTVSNDDVFNMFQNNDQGKALAQKYADLTGTPLVDPQTLTNWLNQAKQQNQSNFHMLSGTGQAGHPELTTNTEKTF